MESSLLQLRAEPIQTTIGKLELRIAERFSDSGLRNVAKELETVAADAKTSIEKLQQPLWWLRCLIALAVVGLIATMVWGTYQFFQFVAGKGGNVGEVVQTVDAGINELIFLALALVFLLNIESRIKRRVALRMLHRLRSMAHIVDMHQLTKDPEYALRKGKPTASSPKRTMTRFELARYLNYCSEMLALISKLAALHAQHSQDHVLLRAVNDVESLSAGLTQGIRLVGISEVG